MISIGSTMFPNSNYVIFMLAMAGFSLQLSTDRHEMRGFLDSGHQIACRKNPINITNYIPSISKSLLRCYKCDCHNHFIRCNASMQESCVSRSASSCKDTQRTSMAVNSTSKGCSIPGGQLNISRTIGTNLNRKTKYHLVENSGPDVSTHQAHLKNASEALKLSLEDFTALRHKLLNRLAKSKNNSSHPSSPIDSNFLGRLHSAPLSYVGDILSIDMMSERINVSRLHIHLI